MRTVPGSGRRLRRQVRRRRTGRGARWAEGGGRRGRRQRWQRRAWGRQGAARLLPRLGSKGRQTGRRRRRAGGRGSGARAARLRLGRVQRDRLEHLGRPVHARRRLGGDALGEAHRAVHERRHGRQRVRGRGRAVPLGARGARACAGQSRRRPHAAALDGRLIRWLAAARTALRSARGRAETPRGRWRGRRWRRVHRTVPARPTVWRRRDGRSCLRGGPAILGWRRSALRAADATARLAQRHFGDVAKRAVRRPAGARGPVEREDGGRRLARCRARRRRAAHAACRAARLPRLRLAEALGARSQRGLELFRVHHSIILSRPFFQMNPGPVGRF